MQLRRRIVTSGMLATHRQFWVVGTHSRSIAGSYKDSELNKFFFRKIFEQIGAKVAPELGVWDGASPPPRKISATVASSHRGVIQRVCCQCVAAMAQTLECYLGRRAGDDELVLHKKDMRRKGKVFCKASDECLGTGDER